MSTLSPEKYIQTRVRTLPIYKCLVNEGWKSSQSAAVVVMRKHNNGNVTAGLYNMDLYCLGVRTTRFYFNRPEEEIFEELESIIGSPEEITYSLAHNIVFAGHDFAMDFEIQPDKDFAITRFILEDDTEDIPIIDVPVGQDGRPHLIVLTANHRKEALAKLEKNAGPGNFSYTVADEENLEDYFLEGVPPDKLNCLNVQNLEDLDDAEQVNKRSPLEQVVINAEWHTRQIPLDSLYVTDEEDAEWRKTWKMDFGGLAAGVTEKQYRQYDKVMDKILARSKSAGTKKDLENEMIAAANKCADNPLLIASFYEYGTGMDMPDLKEVAALHAEKLYQHCPLVKITMALDTLIAGLQEADEREEDADEEDDSEYDDRFDRFGDVYGATTLQELIPGQDQYDQRELVSFALVKMLLCVLEEDLPFSVKYYRLICNSGGERSLFLPFVWNEYSSYLADVLNPDEEEEEEDDDDVNNQTASLN